MPDPTEKQVATSDDLHNIAFRSLAYRTNIGAKEQSQWVVNEARGVLELSDRMATIEQDAQLKKDIEEALLCNFTGTVQSASVERMARALISLFPHLATTEKL